MGNAMRSLAMVAVCLSLSCIRADLIGLRRGEKSPRSCMPGLKPDVGGLQGSATWKADLKEIVDAGEECEVVDFETRISPIGAGFVTFGGFAADMAQKRRDQLLGPAEQGRALADVCAPTSAPTGVSVHVGGVVLPAPNEPWKREPAPPDAHDYYLSNPPEPTYTGVWIPVARRPEAAAAGAASAARSCGPDGTPDGDGTLCTFARVALQPDRARPIVLVGHGLFDSSAHRYVRNTGAVLHAMGFSVALLDLRDHGNTLRANGPLGTGLTFGAREGHDIVSIARQLRGACGVPHAGYVGFSGGAAMGVHAYAVDPSAQLDLGVLAISPLVDPADTIDHFKGEQSGCLVTTALEIDWTVYGGIGVLAVLMAGGGAATYGCLENDDVDWSNTGLTTLGAVGLAVGATLITDLAFDGSSHLDSFDGCLSVSPIANLFKALLEDRWHALGEPYGLTGNPHLANYPKARSGLTLEGLEAAANALPGRVAAAAAAKDARLAIVAADDDPVVGEETIKPFTEKAKTEPDLAVFTSAHGGHTSFAALSPVYARQFLHHFFCSGPYRCP